MAIRIASSALVGLASLAEAMRSVEIEKAMASSAGPPLCDAAIVSDTCRALNYETASYFGSEADQDESIVHAAEIAEYLMTSRDSVLNYLKILGVTNAETSPDALEQGAFAVSCAELCEKVKEDIPESIRPPASDVGCFISPGSDEMECTVDVSPGSMAGFKFDEGSGQEAAGKYHEGRPSGAAFEKSNPRKWLEELERFGHADKPLEVVGHAIANAFRMFPPAHVSVTEASESNSSLLELGGARGSHASRGYPSYGGPGYPSQYSGQYHHASQYPGQYHSSQHGGHHGGSRDYHHAGSHHGSQHGSHQPSATPEWLRKVMEVSLKSQAYLAQAIRNMNSQKVPQVMQRWFGTNDATARAEVRRVLAAVSEMLDNVEYVRQGDQCQDNTYAYVYPKGRWAKNSKGQFVFYLCSLYHRSPLGEQIETLTHEGSHHAQAYTDDVDFQGQTAYGRPLCQKMAQSDTSKALLNADSYCYFINDAYDAYH